jgi:hypothetical protein
MPQVIWDNELEAKASQPHRVIIKDSVELQQYHAQPLQLPPIDMAKELLAQLILLQQEHQSQGQYF